MAHVFSNSRRLLTICVGIELIRAEKPVPLEDGKYMRFLAAKAINDAVVAVNELAHLLGPDLGYDPPRLGLLGEYARPLHKLAALRYIIADLEEVGAGALGPEYRGHA